MELVTLINENKHSDELALEQFSIDVLVGLNSQPKSLSSKYFYDDKGSDLFQQITGHSDYYPTRTELEILTSIQDKLPELMSEDEIDIFELGAGDGHKTSVLLEGFLKAGCKINYYPVDISAQAMQLLGKNIADKDALKVCGVVAEYFEGLRHMKSRSKNKALVLFLGSNIGNFDHAQSQGFLRAIWQVLDQDDHLLIGFDLKKHVDTLTAAYNDSAGLTRDFNLNLLQRINNELRANFEIGKFEHYGVYNPVIGAMESYLLSLEEQDVYIENLQSSFHFAAFEPLHLEYSFKFLESDINLLGKETGYQVRENFTDGHQWFINSLWKVQKDPTLTKIFSS